MSAWGRGRRELQGKFSGGWGCYDTYTGMCCVCVCALWCGMSVSWLLPFFGGCKLMSCRLTPSSLLYVCVCVGCSPLPPLLLSALRSVVASLFAQLFTSHSTTQLLNTATPFPACLVLYESVEYELSRLRLEKDWERDEQLTPRSCCTCLGYTYLRRSLKCLSFT